MKTTRLLAIIVVSAALGFAAGRKGATGTVAAQRGSSFAAVVEPEQPQVIKKKPAAVAEADPATGATGRGKGGPRVAALLAGFDRRRPVESEIKLLQKVLAAKSDEIAEIVRGMAGPWRTDPGWYQAKQAAMQRWVELAPDAAIAWAKVAQQQGAESYEAAGVFGALAELDPSRALNEAKALKAPMLQRYALQSVIGSIAQTDPRKALELGESLPGSARQMVAYSVFSSWSSRDPAAAAAGLLTLKDSNQRQNAAYYVMNHWSDRDPQAALTWAASLREPGLRQNAMASLFGQLGERNPEQALVMAAGLPKHQQVQMYKSMVGGWAQTDPEAAEEWILARTNKIEQQQMILAASNYLDYMAPDRAGTLLSKLGAGSARDQAMQNLIRYWSWSDPAGAMEFSKTLPSAEQKRLRPAVAEALAGRNPEEAIAFLKENPIDDPAHDAWSRLAGAIAEQSDSASALEWARSLPEEVTRRKALTEVIGRMARENPAEAAMEAAGLKDPTTREESMARIGGAWAGNNFDEALAWARGLTGKDRESALGSVLNQGAPHEPASAATQYLTLLGDLLGGEKPADSFVNAAATIAAAYFAEDQDKAAAWVATLPQEDARIAAAGKLAEEWAQFDAAAASEWIGSLPGGKPRDQAVGQLVGKIAASDPAMAFEWTSTVEDSTTRGNLLESTFASWRKIDAPAAREAINGTDWPEDEKAKWLNKVN